MCTVSMIGEHFGEKFTQPDYPQIWTRPAAAVSREEFDRLRADVEEMKKLLLRAKDYDRRSGQPDCEMADKVALLKKVAEFVGVDLLDIFATDEKSPG